MTGRSTGSQPRAGARPWRLAAIMLSALIVAVFVMSPGSVTVAVISNVADAAFATAPTLQTPVPAL